MAVIISLAWRMTVVASGMPGDVAPLVKRSCWLSEGGRQVSGGFPLGLRVVFHGTYVPSREVP